MNSDGNGNIIFDTPAGIAYARMCTLKAALKLELLGMHRRGQSAYSIVKSEFGFRGSKQSVFDQLKAACEEAVRQARKEG